jgi:hypothetical protein
VAGFTRAGRRNGNRRRTANRFTEQKGELTMPESSTIVTEQLRTPSEVQQDIERALRRVDDLESELADVQKRHDARLGAIRVLGDRVEPHWFKTMQAARSVVDAEQWAALVGALLSELNGIASDFPAVVAEANPRFANTWRTHQLDLSSFVRHRSRPIGVQAATLPCDVRELVKVARGGVK